MLQMPKRSSLGASSRVLILLSSSQSNLAQGQDFLKVKPILFAGAPNGKKAQAILNPKMIKSTVFILANK